MRFMHVSVGCSDFDRSYDFYTGVVGLIPLTKQVAETGVVDPALDPSEIGINGRRRGEARSSAEDTVTLRRVLGVTGDTQQRSVLLFARDQPGGPYIDLQQWSEPTGKPRVERQPKDLGLGRIAIFVDDIDAHVARLDAAKVELLSRPEDVVVGATPIRIVCFLDPDGTLLELVEMSSDGWGKKPGGSARPSSAKDQKGVDG